MGKMTKLYNTILIKALVIFQDNLAMFLYILYYIKLDMLCGIRKGVNELLASNDTPKPLDRYISNFTGMFLWWAYFKLCKYLMPYYKWLLLISYFLATPCSFICTPDQMFPDICCLITIAQVIELGPFQKCWY